MSQRQFLPLDDDSLDSEREFDLSSMSAMDYLKQVRSERKKIPQVVTVHPLREPEGSPSSNQERANSDKEKSFHPNDPTKEWRDMQKEKFTEMQLRIAKLRNDPDLASRLSTTLELNTMNEKSTTEFCRTHEPVLSVLLTLNQGQVEELIDTLSSYLDDQTSNAEFLENTANFDWITKWIYASLACLRSPLDPEVHNCLRMIAKSCIQVTVHLKTVVELSGDLFLPWNLIIVVIAICFRQFDLLRL